MQNTGEIKDKIVQFLENTGPSLPVHIASNIQQNSLFTSAFLSELLAERRIKTSNMRIGSSPLYMIQGQEAQLEKFQDSIKGKEKEALVLLKENKFLKDKDQLAPIRIALRMIKDFAKPFKKNDEIIWRYFTISENEYNSEKTEEAKQQETQAEENLKNIIEEKAKEKVEEITEKDNEPKEDKEKVESSQQEVNIFDKEETNNEKLDNKPKSEANTRAGGRGEKPIKKKTSKPKTSASQKKNDKFFNIVKEYLNTQNINIIDIEGFSKNDLILKISEDSEEKILVAYNKKSIKEEDLTKAHKKAQEYGLKYTILSMGQPLKKLQTFIEAVQDLSDIKKIE